MPTTWEMYSKEVAGRIMPMTPANEEYVAITMIEKWQRQGLSVPQVILRWNHPAGVTSGCSSGVNKYGVRWNSCEYVRNVLNILHRL